MQSMDKIYQQYAQMDIQRLVIRQKKMLCNL